MGFEPTTNSLEGCDSATELRPQLSPLFARTYIFKICHFARHFATFFVIATGKLLKGGIMVAVCSATNQAVDVCWGIVGLVLAKWKNDLNMVRSLSERQRYVEACTALQNAVLKRYIQVRINTFIWAWSATP